MLDWSVLPAFIVSALVITLSPGADTFLLLRATIRGGVRDGLATMLGIMTGIAVLSLLLISGVGIVIAKIPSALFVLKIAGSLYLLYLALRSLIAAITLLREHRSRDEEVVSLDEPAGSKSGPYVMGFLTNITNPKVLIFFLAFFPQFLGASDNAVLQLTMLCGVFTVLAVSWLLVIIATATAMRKVMTTPGFTIAMEFVVAAVFAVLAITLLISGLALH